MELKRHLDFRYVFVGLYLLAFLIYLVIGLQPADAKNYSITSNLEIPSISLYSDVAALELNNNQLLTPDEIVGSYSRAKNKTLLIGHSTTVFSNLSSVKVGDEINYDEETYSVTQINIHEKNKIEMSKILAPAEEDTVIIMTCAGEVYDNGDATHRLIITAVKK